MAAAPRCQSQSNSRCCPCMKNGRCVRCLCVKNGRLCVDCWPSTSQPNRCMNKPEAGQRSTVNGATDHQPAVDLQPDTVPSPDNVHQLASDQQLAISTQAEIESLISHLSLPIRTVKQIPRLSRVTVVRRLANVIKQVVSRNDVPFWLGLLSFSKKCLQTPARGGKRWSLATLINKQVIQELSTETPATRPPQ